MNGIFLNQLGVSVRPELVEGLRGKFFSNLLVGEGRLVMFL
jgi:hypothetical protein